MGAALLFWGWAIELPTVGGLLAVAVEGARLLRARWHLEDEDFNRLWNFCSLLFIGATVYAFTANQGAAAISNLIDDPSLSSQRAAGESSQRIAAALFQWQPMIFFPFLLALVFSGRDTVKLVVFSLLARRAKQRREPSSLADYEVHVEWVYLAATLVSATINNVEARLFFPGLCALMAWALWVRRSRRFHPAVWAVTILAACGLAFFGQQQLGELRRFVENFTPNVAWWSSLWSGRSFNVNRSRTEIGDIGGKKGSGSIVVRIELKEGTPAPPLLRTVSYRSYSNATWYAGNIRSGGLAGGAPDSGFPRGEGSRGEGRGGGRGEGRGPGTFAQMQQESGQATWIFREAVTPLRINIATYIDNNNSGDPVPVPLGFARFENLPNAVLQTNHLGTVTAQGSGLLMFDVLYGPVGSIDSPPDGPDGLDLRITPNELSEIERLSAEMNLDGKTDSQKLRLISSYFQDHFTYSLWQKRRHTSRTTTPLGEFLSPTNRSGHCEYFATATVLLLRQLKIPARYAVGWSVQEVSGTTGIIRERHAHAWCLYYLNGQWHDFDTTPASWVAAENDRASAFQFLSDAWSRLKFEIAKWKVGQSGLRDYIWWIVGPLLLFLVYRLAKGRGRRARIKAEAEAQALSRLGLDSEFYFVEKKLKEFGFVRPAGESLGQLLERAVRDARVASMREVLEALLHAHYRLRFDPAGLKTEERETLRQQVRETLDRLAGARQGKSS